MKIILDTNVLVSAIFFGGVPGRILDAWKGGRFTLVVSPDIFEEYRRVAELLGPRFPSFDLDVDLEPLLALILVHGTMVEDSPLPEPVSSDPDDEKFLACALSSETSLIVSGDRHLLDVSGYRDIEILKPRDFVDRFLAN